MALDFPASPNINDTYTFGGVTWTWDGTTWKVLGRFQFTSTETDPVFTASPANNILNQNITNWNLAYGWGDHSVAGYLTSTGSISSHSDVALSTLQDGNLLRFNAGTGNWENWVPNYLTSYTETDPVFSASVAAGINATNIANWNTAYNWGDHSIQGYLTSGSISVDGVSIGDDTDGTRTKSLTLGDDDDLTLFYDGRVGYVTSYIESDQMIIRPKSTPSDTYIDMLEGGPVRLYYGSSTRISTSATGAVVSGILTAGGLTYPNTDGTSGDVLTSDGAGNVTWAAPSGGSGGANVTISDTAPGSASAGDLWWESDKGRLKIYYNDTDSTQWVDASPPLADATSIGGQGTVAMLASIIPGTNNAYDIGSAEYKIRDIYEDQSSDIRLKKDVVDYSGGLNFVESLRVVDFTWKDDVDIKAGKRETGFIAQELGAALEASNYNSWRLHNPNPDSYQGIDPKQLIPALVSAIQELSARVKELENK